ncbi:MAG: tetratricopeptide repeat protein [Proteobacteria bacterium]|nr:tetratricopeptide repeat protein [Pseudomonadota bacterium]
MSGPDASDCDTLTAASLAHHRAGRLAEAEAGYKAALNISPGSPGILHNLGVLAAETGRLREAVGYFDRAIAAEPGYASAYFNKANAVRALGKTTAALENYRQTVSLEPGHYDAHLALGYLWHEAGRRDRALDHFARTFELRRGDDRTGIAGYSLTHATQAKLRHDAGQFRHIARKHREGPRFELLARTYDSVAMQVGGEANENSIAQLSGDQLAALGESYNTPYHVTAAPEFLPGALNPALDFPDLSQRYEASASGLVWFDDLLTPKSLGLLQRFLLESTIWYDFSHIGGCLAAYLEDGLACPLILQIADEMRAGFSGILKDRPLAQIWAFKGIEAGRGIDVHADDGAVSVNFWVTANGANADPDRGGLIIYRKPPPPDWRISDYKTDVGSIRAFLGNDEKDRLVIPYRENRAVLFESRLFHESDAVDFQPGYENHRINITMLFGQKTS